MSPRPAAPRRASVTACRTTSASLWPARPRGCSRRTPPRMRGRPSASRWVSCPLPTRMPSAPRDDCRADCSGRPGGMTTRVRRSAVVAEGRLDGEVLEAHVLLEVGQGDLAGGAVALLADDDLDGALVLARLVHLRPVQEHDGVRVLLDAVVDNE